MERYIVTPNLPNGKVNRVISSSSSFKILYKSLKNLGIDSIKIDSCMNLLPQISDHADMQVCYMGEGLFICAKNGNLNINLENSKIIYTNRELNSKYPADILLNTAIVGKYAICNKKNTSEEVIEILQQKNINIIDVKQGYGKCSVCIVSDNAIITEDESIHINAIKNRIDSLLIKKGYVNLPGFDYGFIGGATGKINKDLLSFTGTIDHHPNKEEILNFLKKYNVKPIFLTDRKIFDIGSIIPITEIF